MFWARCEQSHSAPPTSNTEPPTTYCHKGVFTGRGWKEQNHHHHHHHHYHVDGILWGPVAQPKHGHHHCHRSRSFGPRCDKQNSNIQADQMQHNRFHGHCHRFQGDAAATRPHWFSHCKSRRTDVPKTEAHMFDYSENYN